MKAGNVIINIQGGGSSAGARSVLSGVAEVGMLSRELQGDEKALIPTIIAYDAIALIVHPSNPSRNLDIDEIRSIFTGEITNWLEVGGKSRKIHAVAREEGSGTRGAFDEIIMGTAEVTPGAIVQDSNGAVREIVAGDPSAIGYLSLGLVDKRVKSHSRLRRAAWHRHSSKSNLQAGKAYDTCHRRRPGERGRRFHQFLPE